MGDAVACGEVVTVDNNRATVLDTNLTADVTVTAVAASNRTDCGNGAQRLSLAAADGRTWTLDLNVDGLPANFIRKGDALGLTVATWPGGRTIGGSTLSQSVVVTRGGKTILVTWFGSADAIFPGSPKGVGAPAPVTIAGVNLADDGIICEYYDFPSCQIQPHRALITVGASSAAVSPGQSVSVGGLQVVLQRFEDDVDLGSCDKLGHLTFAAFAP
jgi:hypothetical protein